MRVPPIIRSLSLTIFLSLACATAYAREPVGKIAKASTDTVVVRNDHAYHAEEGRVVDVGDTIRSGNGFVSIVFIDGSIVRLRPLHDARSPTI